MTDNPEQKMLVVKTATAWGGTVASLWLQQLGFNSWADVAAFLAAVYSLFLIIDWVYKRVRRVRATKAEKRYVESDSEG